MSGCNVCAVGASRCLCTQSPVWSGCFDSEMEGSQEKCLALKSPTTNTGRAGDGSVDELSGRDASAICLAIAAMSCCFALCDIYVPPITIGVDNMGDDIHTNPRRVRVSLGLYGVSCGM